MRFLRDTVLIFLGVITGVYAEERGGILSESWLGINGNVLTGMTGDARYPDSPSLVSVLTSFQTPVNTADNYGTRVRGFLYPPVTGAYRFWVAGDDQCELWLSTDDSPAAKVLIANIAYWTTPQEWAKYPSQQSVEIILQAGSRYYIEALHKEGAGGDSLAVAWAYPGADRHVIPGEFLAPAVPAPQPGTGTGYLLREWWSGLPGTSVTDLTTAPLFPASPSGRDYLTSFETPANWGDQYGTRLRGFLHPAQTGTYTFWIAGDDACQLWLSQDAEPLQKRLLAHVPGHTAARQWTKYPQQHSVAIDLQAGSAYYIEAIQKEGGGGDIVSVAWSGPGIGDSPTVITGAYLSPSAIENQPDPVGLGTGTILVETWNDIPGNLLAGLVAHPFFPDQPSSRTVATQFTAPTDVANSYGRRLRGYLCPAITGTYQFWIASDDEGSLSLSTDESPGNAVVIARVPAWTGPEQWDRYPEQQSALISLVGGQRYYIEALQKEGVGGDHVAVAWAGPSLGRSVISGTHLAPVVVPLIAGVRTFTDSTTVTITSSGDGGSVHVTTDGTTPTAASPQYTAPVVLTASTVVKAVVVDEEGHASEIAEQAFVRQGTGTGLVGSYFANEYFAGQPMQRLDHQLGFVWGQAAPMAGIPADRFSVRWQGDVETQLNEDYTLIVRSDDGVRVWLDGILVINDWTHHSATEHACVLPPGRHALTIDYMEGLVHAELQLFWQSHHQPRALVPTSQLYPLVGVQGIIPPASQVSPAYVEVVHGSGAVLTATVAGTAAVTRHLDDTIRYLNVPLTPTAPVAVEVSSSDGGASLRGDIAWAPTILAGHKSTIIRQGDSLLLLPVETGSVSVTNYSGTYLGPLAVTPGQRLPVHFTKPGEFTVRMTAQGVEVATLEVTVVMADLTQAILCEVGYTRSVAITVAPVDAPLIFLGNSQVTVTTEAVAQDLASLHLTPLRRGTPRLQARIHGPRGPLVAEQAIDEFTIDNAALHSAVVNAQTGIGTVTLVMRPYIPGQIFRMAMFAHRATFKGGATSLTIDSTGGPSSNGEPPMVQHLDQVSQETIGVFRFDLEIPEDENKYCFNVARHQADAPTTTGAYLPRIGPQFGLPAQLPASITALLMGSHSGGSTDGPTTNVNGDVCHVLAYASLIFTRATDASENEIQKTGNSEVWSSRQWSLITADYCTKGDYGDGNCNSVSYKLEVSDPPPFSGELDNPIPALFGASDKESDCKTCTGSCGPITPAMDSGTIPGQYTTSVTLCSAGDGDTVGSADGGVFFVSKVDAYGSPSSGSGSTRAKFVDYGETLPKRAGTVFQPIIQMNSGGDQSVNGCSLYGWTGEPFCPPMNKWSFKAIAEDPEEPGSNIPTAKGYSIKWRNIPGHDGSSEESLNDVPFPVGRHLPRLEVWFTDPDPPEGASAEPSLIATAEIHSIVVEPYPSANVAGKNSDVVEKQRRGGSCFIRNDAGGQTVDVRLSIVGPGTGSSAPDQIRGRVSLDGYPQNEYRVKTADADDLPQVVSLVSGQPIHYYVQGYDAPSGAKDDLKLVAEGQALLEVCSECAPFLGTPVQVTWQVTDEEPFNSYARRLRTLDVDSGAIADNEKMSASVPHPVVSISSVSAHLNTSGGAQVAISGQITSKLCDISTEATVDTMSVYRAWGTESLGSISVNARKESSGQLPKPYAYTGSFSGSVHLSQVAEGINILRFEAADTLYGHIGMQAVAIDVVPNSDYDPNPQGPFAGFTAFAQPLRVALDFAATPSLRALAGVPLPSSLAEIPGGYVLADPILDQVVRLAPDGSVAQRIGHSHSAGGTLDRPAIVRYAGAARLLIADAGRTRLQVLNGTGLQEAVALLHPADGFLQEVLVAADGSILALLAAPAHAIRYTNDLVEVERFTLPPAVDGQPWVAATRAHEIALLTTTGARLMRLDLSGQLVADIPVATHFPDTRRPVLLTGSASGYDVLASDGALLRLDDAGTLLEVLTTGIDVAAVPAFLATSANGYAYLDGPTGAVVILASGGAEVGRHAVVPLEGAITLEHLLTDTPDVVDTLTMNLDGSYRLVGSDHPDIALTLPPEVLKALDQPGPVTPRTFVAPVSAEALGLTQRLFRFQETAPGSLLFRSEVLGVTLTVQSSAAVVVELSRNGTPLSSAVYVQDDSTSNRFTNAAENASVVITGVQTPAQDGWSLDLQHPALGTTTLQVIETGPVTNTFTSAIRSVVVTGGGGVVGGGGYRVQSAQVITPATEESLQAYLIEIKGVFEESSVLKVEDLEVQMYNAKRRVIRNSTDDKFYIGRAEKDEVDVFILSPLNAFQEGN